MLATAAVTVFEVFVGVVLLGGGFIVLRPRKRKMPKAKPLEGIDLSSLPVSMHDKLTKTRSGFATTLAKLRGQSTIDPSFWKGIEDMLLIADVGSATSQAICSSSKAICDERKISSVSEAFDVVRESLLDVFQVSREPVIGDNPNVWLFVGVNGVGKTTSIAKIGNKYRERDKSVLFVAGDTFRAAAADQLETWATRTGADIVRNNEGADPASVVFDGMEKANAKNYDVVLVDTAGRLHTKSNLMEEVKKIKRVVERTKDALKEVLLVIDATTGQNGLIQAREFGEALGVTGVVLTKLDGSAKGGIALAIEHELGVPIKWVGLGEAASDLIEFDPKSYVDALLS
jgi:fused signal recognition particle receptor